MKNNQTTEVKLNDELNVQFLKNSGNGRPVCRINGKVGFIDQKYKGFIAPGSSWMVSVIDIKSRFVTVWPIIETHTAKENHEEFLKKLVTLKESKNGQPSKSKKFTTIMRL